MHESNNKSNTDINQGSWFFFLDFIFLLLISFYVFIFHSYISLCKLNQKACIVDCVMVQIPPNFQWLQQTDQVRSWALTSAVSGLDLWFVSRQGAFVFGNIELILTENS